MRAISALLVLTLTVLQSAAATSNQSKTPPAHEILPPTRRARRSRAARSSPRRAPDADRRAKRRVDGTGKRAGSRRRPFSAPTARGPKAEPPRRRRVPTQSCDLLMRRDVPERYLRGYLRGVRVPRRRRECPAIRTECDRVDPRAPHAMSRQFRDEWPGGHIPQRHLGRIEPVGGEQCPIGRECHRVHDAGSTPSSASVASWMKRARAGPSCSSAARKMSVILCQRSASMRSGRCPGRMNANTRERNLPCVSGVLVDWITASGGRRAPTPQPWPGLLMKLHTVFSANPPTATDALVNNPALARSWCERNRKEVAGGETRPHQGTARPSKAGPTCGHDERRPDAGGAARSAPPAHRSQVPRRFQPL